MIRGADASSALAVRRSVSGQWARAGILCLHYSAVIELLGSDYHGCTTVYWNSLDMERTQNQGHPWQGTDIIVCNITHCPCFKSTIILCKEKKEMVLVLFLQFNIISNSLVDHSPIIIITLIVIHIRVIWICTEDRGLHT